MSRTTGAREDDAEPMTTPPPHGPAACVRVVPLHRCLLVLLLVLVPWSAVVLGRAVCLVAQRVPPLVHVVRAVRRWSDDRPVRPTGSPGAGGSPLPRSRRARRRVATVQRQHCAGLAERIDSR